MPSAFPSMLAIRSAAAAAPLVLLLMLGQVLSGLGRSERVLCLSLAGCCGGHAVERAAAATCAQNPAPAGGVERSAPGCSDGPCGSSAPRGACATSARSASLPSATRLADRPCPRCPSRLGWPAQAMSDRPCTPCGCCLHLPCPGAPTQIVVRRVELPERGAQTLPGQVDHAAAPMGLAAQCGTPAPFRGVSPAPPWRLAETIGLRATRLNI